MTTGFGSYGYSRAILMGSASILALIAYSSANAQQANTASPAAAAPPTSPSSPAAGTSDQLTEIVVTGYRASLQSALDTKRNSNLPVESVSAEDIGKMPDQNIAESLQRLPGVQIDRGPTGEGTAVLIDGLRQNLTTLNGDVFLTGREFYVSGEGSGGGAGGNAQYNSLEGIPSEEIGQVVVYKNPQASMTEGGLGGTIDLRTRDPLAGPDGLSLGGNFRESYAQRQDDWTPNGTLVGSYKFSDVLAFTASISYDDEKTLDEEFQDQNRNQWLITNSATGPYVGALTPAGLTTLPKSYIEPQLAYFTNDNDERKDYGASFGVSAKIGEAITSSFNWFYSREQETSLSYTDKVWFNGQGTSAGVLLPGIDPTQAVLDRRQRRGSERGLQRQWRRDCHPVSGGHGRRPQFPVGDEVQRWRSAARRPRSLVRQRDLRSGGRSSRCRARPVYHQCRRGHLAGSAGLQQRCLDLHQRHRQPWL